uniref:Uncharacterized protein n=1 Tax=Chenopodium quinoa TaxID=63459 RepID=A0A803KUZ9_CHEQI
MSCWPDCKLAEGYAGKARRLASAEEMDLKPCVIVHHGGEWVLNEDTSYMGGRVSIFEDIPDYVDVYKAIHVYTEHEIGHSVDIDNSFGLGGRGGYFIDLLSGGLDNLGEPFIDYDSEEDTTKQKSYDDELEMFKRDFGYLVAPECKKTKVSSTVGGDASLTNDSKFFVG